LTASAGEIPTIIRKKKMQALINPVERQRDMMACVAGTKK
jgi:hypothetical protein